MRHVQKYSIYVGASLLLPFAAFSLHYFGLKRTCRILGIKLARERGKETLLRSKESQKDAEQLYRIVHRVARHFPWKLECLPRSVTVCTLLKWIHETGVLRISVKHSNRHIEAHAWVEFSRIPLGEQDPQSKGLQPLS